MPVAVEEPTELRVRPPRPGLPRSGRVALLVGVLVVALGVVALLVAVGQDHGAYPGQGMVDRRVPPPGSAVDGFDRAGPLGRIDGLGTWTVAGGTWRAERSQARPSPVGRGRTSALVAGPATDLVLHVHLAAAPSGTAVLARQQTGGDGLAVVADPGTDGWSVVITTGGVASLAAAIPGSHADVTVRIFVQGSKAVVRVDDDGRTVDLPAPLSGGSVGIAATDPATRVDEVAVKALSG